MTVAAEGTGVSVEASVWRTTAVSTHSQTLLARGVFVDSNDAQKFVRNQVSSLAARGIDDVVIHVIRLEDDGSTRRDNVRRGDSVASALLDIFRTASSNRPTLLDPTQVANSDRFSRSASTNPEPAGTDAAAALSVVLPTSGSGRQHHSSEPLSPELDMTLARRTSPVVLYLEARDQQLSDYGYRWLWTSDREAILHTLDSDDLNSFERAELSAELALVDDLYEADTNAYINAWVTAATKRARQIGLSESVPVLLSISDGGLHDDGIYEPIYHWAFAVTPLPGLAYVPREFPYQTLDGEVDIAAFMDAERSAGRSYRDRARRQRGNEEGTSASSTLAASRTSKARHTTAGAPCFATLPRDTADRLGTG